MNEWKIVNQKIKISKQKRINWKKYLGQSLTSIITEYNEKGYDRITIIWIIIYKIQRNGYDIDYKIYDLINTSVCSRIAEQKQLEKRKIKN